jgi:hypothetical protein
MGFRTWLDARFVSASAVYGTILYSALIAVVSTDDDTSLSVLFYSLLSLVIFWAAHIYAGTVANHGVKNGTEIGLRAAFRMAVAESSGMLWAAILPSVALILGGFGLLSYDVSVVVALWIAVVVLGVLGFLAFAQRRSRIVIRILGAIGTALFGLVMIVLNTAVH